VSQSWGYFLSSIVIVLSSLGAEGRNLIVPTPELPTVFDPAKSLDVFSNSAIRQIHKTLFKLDISGEPSQDLLSNFSLSTDGLKYTLQLAPNKFSNGENLNASHVKSSIERALRLKINGFQKFSCLQGFDEFMSSRSKAMPGIRVNNPAEVVLELKCKISQLPYLLSDLRLAIVFDDRSPEIGLGAYKLSSSKHLSSQEITLVSNRNDIEFSSVRYVKASPQDAIKMLADPSKHVVLFSYKFDSDQISNLKKISNFVQMRSWTNYFLAVNSSRNPSEIERRSILSRINRQQLIKRCYSNEVTDDNIFPYGFPGYVSGLTQIENNTKVTKLKKKKFLVSIFNGVGSEECAKTELSKQLGSAFDIEVIATDDGISKWVSNRTDLILFYLESELNMDVSQFFVLDAEFFLGEKRDANLSALVNRMSLSNNPKEYKEIALALQKRVLDQKLLMPLFVPKTEFAFSNQLEVPDLGMVPPTYLTLKDLKIKREKR